MDKGVKKFGLSAFFFLSFSFFFRSHLIGRGVTGSIGWNIAGDSRPRRGGGDDSGTGEDLLCETVPRKNEAELVLSKGDLNKLLQLRATNAWYVSCLRRTRRMWTQRKRERKPGREKKATQSAKDASLVLPRLTMASVCPSRLFCYRLSFCFSFCLFSLTLALSLTNPAAEISKEHAGQVQAESDK